MSQLAKHLGPPLSTGNTAWRPTCAGWSRAAGPTTSRYALLSEVPARHLGEQEGTIGFSLCFETDGDWRGPALPDESSHSLSVDRALLDAVAAREGWRARSAGTTLNFGMVPSMLRSDCQPKAALAGVSVLTAPTSSGCLHDLSTALLNSRSTAWRGCRGRSRLWLTLATGK